jgi:hypothetical protein
MCAMLGAERFCYLLAEATCETESDLVVERLALDDIMI